MRRALLLAILAGCSGGETSTPSSTTAPAPATAPATAPTTAPTTSIAAVDAFPAAVDWPVVPASDAHDAPLPPGVLPDDFGIVIRPRTDTTPTIELRPRTGMSGRWELVAADAEPLDEPTDPGESLIWSIEVPARRVAGIYAYVLGHEDGLVCGAPTGLRAFYVRRSRRVACEDGPEATLLRARLEQLVTDFSPP